MGCNCSNQRHLSEEYELLPEFEASMSSCPSPQPKPDELEKVQNAISKGERNENVLSDMIFFDRHPELNKKPLYTGQQCFNFLSKEWLDMRNQIIRPALANKTPRNIEGNKISKKCYGLTNFDTGSSSIYKSSHLEAINKIVSDIIKSQNTLNPITRVIATGYADPRGSSESNFKLGLRRANAVIAKIRDQLTKKQPSLSSKISYKSMSLGESKQVPGGNNFNRRVEVCFNTSSQTTPIKGLSLLREKIVKNAKDQWYNVWKKGTRVETETGMDRIIQLYWEQGIGNSIPITMPWNELKWSAAFVSWVIRKSFGGTEFKYSEFHSEYTCVAKTMNTKFKAFPGNSVKPEVGDIIVSNLCEGATFENICDKNKDEQWQSTHGDIVVNVDVKNDMIEVIGGNTYNEDSPGCITSYGSITVGRRYKQLNRDGYLRDPQWIAIIKPD